MVVIASRQRYDAPQERLPAVERVGGVEVHRVSTSRFGRANLAGRSLDYLTFYLSAAWRLARLVRRGDIVVVKTDPPLLSLVVGPIAALRGARRIDWLQDLFPEVAGALGIGAGRLGKAGQRLLARLRDRSLRRAAAVVAIGDRMAARVAAAGVPQGRIHVLPNWADGRLIRPIDRDANPLRAAWGLGEAFVVGYSGNLGRAHDYRTLLDAIGRIERAVSDGPPILFLFIGGGAQYEAFRRAVAAEGLGSVRFEPYQPRERLAESLSAADLHLVSLRPALEGLIVPSKFYGIAAAGRPTLFIGAADGEVARLLAAHRCGATAPEGDGAALAATVLDLARHPDRAAAMGARARAVFEREWDRPVALARWRALLDDIAPP
ncbi:glycosyltransferase involved in cell wall biosynthesis [Prosthecomicrobium pneumaticum]|uniref:Glycosyltransferase involved in cell wall biosynthesis n=1 Tax=Prosthecomicrobium pneumaticum TaxID=81895 RepID=A0A7W9CTZ5_9HYPH|nr:glycosyltransferase involved in cell wall biosynthesis [Prosthecomicrobium pneumaticum]